MYPRLDTVIDPRQKAEEQFKLASGEAALFELRMRMLAGQKIPDMANLPIDTKLADVRDKVLQHYGTTLTVEETNLLKRASGLRNKLLHCEFSATRSKLNQIESKPRNGGVTKIDISGLSGSGMLEKITTVITGQDVGQISVGGTKTKVLKDVYGWLLECQSANEFEEAAKVFRQALPILDRLSEMEQTKAT